MATALYHILIPLFDYHHVLESVASSHITTNFKCHIINYLNRGIQQTKPTQNQKYMGDWGTTNIVKVL